MNRREKLKLYFKMNSRYYGLLNLIQMGKGGEIDLKITDYYNGMAIITENQQNPRKGYLSEEDLTSAKFVKKVEMSYHKDGSFLTKINDGLTPMYNNPYGEGVRWTPTDDINKFQPIMNICIRRMAIYIIHLSRIYLPLNAKRQIIKCPFANLSLLKSLCPI